jgi:DNA modification methylase
MKKRVKSERLLRRYRFIHIYNFDQIAWVKFGKVCESLSLRAFTLGRALKRRKKMKLMSEPKQNVYQKRSYKVTSSAQAKKIVAAYLSTLEEGFAKVKLGLPEVDDRYHVWRVPILDASKERVGEVVIGAKSGEVDLGKSSENSVMMQKISNSAPVQEKEVSKSRNSVIVRSALRNTLVQGDAEVTLAELPAESVDLVFTSPPYFNARPDYTEYAAYEEYLSKMRRIIQQCHRLLSEGRFFVINVSPVLIRRTDRSSASRRIAVPFDLHRIFIEEGFDFIDDIIWEKPSGAGWATGRGRRFAADRNPLQYKAVPVTEYVLVYRKRTDRLIDWNIRNHHDQDAVQRSKVADGYEQTNIWRINPAYSKFHPAIFPSELAERVIRYYSFEGDVVLDPFGGSGTTGKVAYTLNRKFVLSELDADYVDLIRRDLAKLMKQDSADVMCIGCNPIDPEASLF